MIIDARPYFSIRKAATIEQRYEKDLKKVGSEMGKLANSHDPNNIESIEDLINELKDYSSKIMDWAKNTANKMLGGLDRQNKKDWESLSSKMSLKMKKELQDADTGKALKRYMDMNVELITSLPLDAAQRLHKIVLSNLYTGKARASRLALEIQKMGDVTKSRASTIARTEVSRAATGLIKVRSESVGLNWFVWRAVHDIRTRKGHKLLDGVLVRWDDPPSPEELAHEKRSYGKYLPGSIFNCRCFAAPLVRVNDVSWPARVYHKGKITRMNREQFLNIKENEKYRKAA